MVTSHRKTRRGANAVEFALLAPVLLALMTGTMDLGYLVALRYCAASAADHAARSGAATPRDRSPEEAALEEAVARWTSFGLPMTPTVVTFREGTPELMVVRFTVAAEPLVGLVPARTSFEVTRVRRMEQQP
jgi:Flp pilus assembly protein TadG